MPIVMINERKSAVKQVALWHHEQWGYLHPTRSFNQLVESFHEYQDTSTLPLLWIYEHKGRVMGTVELCQHDMTSHKDLSPWLASVYVDPKKRKKGIGRKLVEFGIAQAQSKNYKNLYLFTPDKEEFYKYFGFIVLSHPTYKGQTVSLMKLNLGN